MGTGVGGRIRIARLNNGWTQDELATRMGKTKSLISKVENGLDNLTSDKIGEYADALNVKPAELMGWDEAETIELKEIYSNKKHIKCYVEKINSMQYQRLLDAAEGCTWEQIQVAINVLDAFKKQNEASSNPPEGK